MSRSEYHRVWYAKNKERIKQRRAEYHKVYYMANKEKIENTNAKWKIKNKEKLREQHKKWCEENKDKRRASRRKHYYKNKAKIRESYRDREKKDSLYRFKIRTKGVIKTAIKRGGYTKNSLTYKILGCSYDFFMRYIESKFSDGMNFGNMGKWHFDHIIPISSAKNEQEIIKLNHYTNFQPLWAKDNLTKSNKIIETQLTLI